MEIRPVLELENICNVNKQTIDLTKQFSPFVNLDDATIIIRIRNYELHAGGAALFNAINSQYPSSFFMLHIVVSSLVGFVKRTISKNQVVTHTVEVNASEQAQVNMINTIALRIQSGVGYKLYLNGKLIKEYLDKDACFLRDINDLAPIDTVLIGRMMESQKLKLHGALYHGDIDFFHLYDTALPEELIIKITGETIPDFSVKVDHGTYLSEPYLLCYPGYQGAQNFRIPTVLKTKNNTLLVAFDQMFLGPQDHPNRIYLKMRRSTDGGDTFEEAVTIGQLPLNGQFIDSCMVQDEETDRIFLLTDAHPENMNTFTAAGGLGFEKDNGVARRILLNDAGQKYLQEKDGSVTFEGKPTNYHVSQNNELFFSGEYIGHIFTEKCPLRVVITSYLLMLYSDDDGKTWSRPIDLNPILKEEWMNFFGCGPGRGIQLKYGKYKGRLLMPVYYFNKYGIQSPAFIYSDDHGETWKRGESLNDNRLYYGEIHQSKTTENWELDSSEAQGIELPNGDVQLYAKNYRNPTRCIAVATSHDGGATFDPLVTHDPALHSTYSMSIIELDKKVDGKHAYAFSNSDSQAGNYNGAVKIGLFEEEPNGYRINWKYSRLIKPGTYGYCFLTNISDDIVGVCYESSGALDLSFRKMDVAFLMSEDMPVNPVTVTKTKMNSGECGLEIEIHFNQLVMLSGNRTVKVQINNLWYKAKYIRRENKSSVYVFLIDEIIEGDIEKISLPEDLDIVSVNGMLYRYKEDMNSFEWVYYNDPYISLIGSGAV